MKKGDIIKFGKYPQDSNDSKSPIEWLVLDVKGNEALLISRYGLDCKRYHHERDDITWEDCDLRKWLNCDFLKSAFSNCSEGTWALRMSFWSNTQIRSSPQDATLKMKISMD